jgi:hypothetical protein
MTLGDELRRVAREKANREQAARERVAHEERLRAEREQQETRRAAYLRRIEDARAHARRPRAVGIISTLTPVVHVPHRRDACGYHDCAQRCPETTTQRAPRSPVVAAWMRAEVAACGPDAVGFVAGVSGVELERGPQRPITAALLTSRGTEWEEWATCSVVDLIADRGTLVVLRDTDADDAGVNAACALAFARGITVIVRRAPC